METDFPVLVRGEDMEREKLLNSIIQELAAQRSLLGDRALNLAGELAEARERITELEKENTDLKREHPRAVK